ncbi:hypothetical protein DCC39_00320 [Pueribacillus theae]|uniref:Peptidyl-prolyl cis-trans isomerase n=1 Tax=Pueribacillus theae TaxID=2171751 RepID=A0A2U1K7L0_9BACI|nr:peptidyl-prolyl cis-trans isomerase [Pueribacillus theae]PWA13372.1 hypothetical protein DCC39_00320 [Pueribacillus theae]
MSNIIQLTGKLDYNITLDPSVWIFDDRKIELEECFHLLENKVDDIEDYTKAISEQWDKERVHGVSSPPVEKSVNQKKKDEVLKGSYVMPFRPFIENASPSKDITNVQIVQKNGEKIIAEFSKVRDAFLCFALNGKPLVEDGPVHLYFRDGSNRDHPIKNIVSFHFE